MSRWQPIEGRSCGRSKGVGPSGCLQRPTGNRRRPWRQRSRRLLGGSGVSREAPAPFCERPEVKLLRPTRHAFETAKTELGLAHNETCSWHGWHRHVSLVMLAFALMAAVRHRANQTLPPKTKTRAPSRALIRWSVQKIRRVAVPPGVFWTQDAVTRPPLLRRV